MAEDTWSNVDSNPLGKLEWYFFNCEYSSVVLHLSIAPDEDDLSDIITVLTEVAANWRRIGLFLRIRDSHLEAIQQEDSRPLDCLIRMLATWLRRNYNMDRFGEPTWVKLVKAVDNPAGGGNHDLAMKIARAHEGTDESTTEDRQRQIRELQQEREKLQREKRELQQEKLELQQHYDEQIRELQEENEHLRQMLQDKHAKNGKSPKWGKCKAPKMIRGSATVWGNMAYFRPGFSQCVQAYDSETDMWSDLPVCPKEYFTLIVVKGIVTAVGGWQSSTWIDPKTSTDTLLSLIGKKGGRREWVEHFSRMPTKRDLTAVVCSEKALVVAGGVQEKGIQLTTVEVMDIKTCKWSTASSLPQPLYGATATVCGDRVYLIGGCDQDGWTKSVLTCSLDALSPSQSSQAVWDKITDLPVTCSSCVTLNRQLVAVGGQDSNKKVTDNIYSYNADNNSWEVISHMTTSRCWCLATVLPHNELMVMGGWTGTKESDIAETAQF